MQFFLGFATLLFKFGQELFRIDQRLFARTFQVLDKAVGKLLQQVQGVVTGFLLADMTCLQADVVAPILDPQTLSPTGSMCYKRRAPGLPADSSGETACRAAFSSVFSTAAAAFRRAPKDELAYAVGARLGTRLQQEMPDLELSELLLGLRQAYRGEALEIPERIEKLLLQHENATTETPRITPAEARFLANEKPASASAN